MELTQLQRDNKRLSAENARLRADYDRMKNERDQFRGESAKVRGELGRLRVSFATRENETSELQNRYDAVTCALADLRGEFGRDSPPHAIPDGNTSGNPSHSNDLSMVTAETNNDLEAIKYQGNVASIPMKRTSHQMQHSGNTSLQATSSSGSKRAKLQGHEDHLPTHPDSNEQANEPDRPSQRPQVHVPESDVSLPPINIQEEGQDLSQYHGNGSPEANRLQHPTQLPGTKTESNSLIDTPTSSRGRSSETAHHIGVIPSPPAASVGTQSSNHTDTRRSPLHTTRSISGRSSQPMSTPEAEHDQVLPARTKKLISQGPDKSQKVKAETLVLPSTSIAKYTENIPAFIIDPPPLSIEMDREFLGTEYGCARFTFIGVIPPKKNPSSRKSNPLPRHVVLPTPDVNPYIPKTPGEPGLLFSNRCEVLNDNPWTLIVRVSTGPAIWRYFGEYECESRGSLLPEEFNSQKEKVKQAWAKKLLDKAWPVYARIRARIYLRKKNVLLTEEAITAEMNNPKKGELKAADIINALCRGDEEIKVIGMKCIGYDHHFARDAAAKLKVWNSPAAVEKRKREAAAKKASKKEKGGKGKKASKHVRDEESSEDEDDMVQVETPSKRVSRRIMSCRAVWPSHISSPDSEDEGSGGSEYEGHSDSNY